MQEKKLTVVHIITKLDLGGAQKACLLLLNGIRKHGDTAILISGAQGELVGAVEGDQQVILLDTFKREAGLWLLWADLKSAIKMIRTLRAIRKNVEAAGTTLVVHTHCPKAGIMGRWAAFFAGVKTRVHTVHGPSLHEHQSWLVWLPIYALELITSLITTHYVCVASSDVAAGKKLFPRFGKKNSIIRAAVDWDRFGDAHILNGSQTEKMVNNLPTVSQSEKIKNNPLIPSVSQSEMYRGTNQGPQPFVFGTVACFKPPKNLFDLIKAFAYVHTQHPHTRLEIVGDGALRPQIEACIAEHRVTDAVTLHGWQHNVIPIMKRWHAFAFSSLWEGLPCAVVEARLLKLPVVSYTTGGVPDVIQHGRNGLLYAQKDWRALADGMLQLVTSPQLRDQLGNHTDDLSDFNHATMVKQHIQLYKTLAK